MSHSLAELAELARATIAERIWRDENGELRFVATSDARPKRIAMLRESHTPTAELIAAFPELSLVDVKAARICSYLKSDDQLSRVDALALPENKDLVERLQELASVVHAGRGCCPKFIPHP